MKKQLFTLAVAALSVCASAQQFVLINGYAVPADQVERITYEKDADFKVLPQVLTDNENVSLFAQALQLTGLADSLATYYDFDYADRYEREDLAARNGQYRAVNYMQYVEMLRRRYVKYSVFAETDEVFAAHGIASLADLQAYAKRVYDDVYPEDAAVSAPTDRRNSLNRFVAYHLLPLGTTQETLTASGNFLHEVADVSDWYATMMPHASLKVSRPLIDGTSDYYVNRRGVQDGADRYGVQVRGAKVTKAISAANGTCYLIDDLLAYDRRTQEEVLQERWRVDFVTLSPDFMNASTRAIRASGYDPSGTSNPAIGFANGMKGMAWNEDADVWIGPIRSAYWNYGGDEVDVLCDNGHIALTVDLPPLPAGEWELRFGTCMTRDFPVVEFTLDDGSQLTSTFNQELNSSMNKFGYSSPSTSSTLIEEFCQSHRTQIDALLAGLTKSYIWPTGFQPDNNVQTEEYLAYVEKLKTYYIPTDAQTLRQLVNEQVLVSFEEDDAFYVHDVLLNATYEERELEDGTYWFYRGTETEVDLDERETFYCNVLAREAFRLNGFLYGPKDYWIAYASTLNNIPSLSRRIVGRFTTDGRTDHKLRIETIYSHGTASLILDYLEFCPVNIADHATIPEN